MLLDYRLPVVPVLAFITAIVDSLLTLFFSTAFILYRQHHQQAVVAQNPGLANPEISKIIGDHWRNSPIETKEHWKLLADVRTWPVPI